MSTRATLMYYGNRSTNIHIYHEILDDTVRVELEIFNHIVFTALRLPKGLFNI